ncbi:Hypothetical Protein FCC1311_002872 [Hondaea fermentalgiana]|uniref:Uncharacterized protein n=1 Tax=Hondaea fermentalgiana TaxID=2315210 RepID=A0A2R5G1A3_9STRA|nr:Hypothetical Protein FCC1311_002872 [Hondaea fermentalgiana]|eukprot:GBG24069.1 Hypothetical Protein FCC1311_002872 [Hondaea fermentalgiana]
MIAFGYVVIFVGGLFASLVAWHHVEHGVLLQPLQTALALFLSINVLICLWEIVLFFYVDKIKAEFDGRKKKVERGYIGSFFLFEEASLAQALTPSFWTQVWSTYALVDRSYADTHSYGWAIDIGNGFTMLVPSLIFAVGMTLQEKLMPARVLGIIGLFSFYQGFYGTVLYFMQYCVHRRWNDHGSTPFQIFSMVICTNIIWMVFPLLGIYASCQLILSDDKNPFAIFV